MSKKVTATLPDNVYEQALQWANRKDMSLSSFIKHCIVVYVTALNSKMK